jgi:hypothetical protein
MKKEFIKFFIALLRFAMIVAALAVLCFAENKFELWTIFSVGYLFLCEISRRAENFMS